MRTRFVVVASLILCLLVGCTQDQGSILLTEETATEYLQEFYAAGMDNDLETAVNYVFYPEERREECRYAFTHGGVLVNSYDILDCKKINENLFAFAMEAQSIHTEATGIPDHYYNFVMRFEDRLYVVTNSNNVPDSICDSSVLVEYSHSTEDSLGQEDIVGKL